MTRATSSRVGRRPNVLAHDRWSRFFEGLTFSTAHLENTCALAWYASHPELRRAVTASRPTGSRGARGDPRWGAGNGRAPYFANRGKQRVRTRANRWRGILALLALAGLIGLGLGVATGQSADPKHGVLPLECDELGSLEIAVPGNGFTPDLVAARAQVGVPYAITLAGSIPVGEPEPILNVFEQRAPAHDRLDHCTLHQEGVDELGTFVLDGDVWISYTPTH